MLNEEIVANWTGGFWDNIFNSRYQQNWIEDFLDGFGVTYNDVYKKYGEAGEKAILKTLPHPALFPITIVKNLIADALAPLDADLEVILESNTHDQRSGSFTQILHR